MTLDQDCQDYYERWAQKMRDVDEDTYRWAAGQSAAQLLHPYPSAGITGYELDIIRDFTARTAGIPDTFDQLGSYPSDDGDRAEQLAYLVDNAGLLRRWWEAIDSLESDLSYFEAEDRSDGNPAVQLLSREIHDWFTTRQQWLYAVARCAGADLCQPDQPDGGVMGNNGYIGNFGYQPNT